MFYEETQEIRRFKKENETERFK